MSREFLIVDAAYDNNEYPGNVIVKVNDEYYLIPTLNRNSNDLTSFKKIEHEVIKNKNLTEISRYRYTTLELEKREGHDIPVGRSITDKELNDLKEELHLTDDDISDPFEETIGAIYGEKSEKKFRCIQISVEEVYAVRIEEKLKKKGIQAANVSAGRLNIRIPV